MQRISCSQIGFQNLDFSDFMKLFGTMTANAHALRSTGFGTNEVPKLGCIFRGAHSQVMKLFLGR